MNENRSPDDRPDAPSDAAQPMLPPDYTQFTGLVIRKDDYTDSRKPWDWQSKYPKEARREINFEAFFLSTALAFFLVLSGFFLSVNSQSLHMGLGWLGSAPSTDAASTPPPALALDCRLLALFFVGCVGGTTFSIKWLVHAAAKGQWHLDRRYWRLLVPFVGGVYACVVLTLIDAGFVGGQLSDKPRPLAIAAAFAFLVGYFSDGVSGLLSNVANAVFGTLDRK